MQDYMYPHHGMPGPFPPRKKCCPPCLEEVDHLKHCDCDCVCKCQARCSDTCSSKCSDSNPYCYTPCSTKPYFTNWFQCFNRYCGSPCNFLSPELKIKDAAPVLEPSQVLLPVVHACYEADLYDVETEMSFTALYPGIRMEPPYTFIEGGTSGAVAEVSDLSIEPTRQDGYSRLRALVSFPANLTVKACGCNGNELSGTAMTSFPLDLMICTPDDCDYPFNTQINLTAEATGATLNPETGIFTVTMNICVEIFLVVVRPCNVYSDGSCADICERPESEEEDCVPCWDPGRKPWYRNCGYGRYGGCGCGGGCGGYGGYGGYGGWQRKPPKKKGCGCGRR